MCKPSSMKKVGSIWIKQYIKNYSMRNLIKKGEDVFIEWKI